MMLRGRYKSRFGMVSDVVWLSLCVAAVVVWFVFFHHRFENEAAVYIVVIAAVVVFRPLATWITRRFGVEEE